MEFFKNLKEHIRTCNDPLLFNTVALFVDLFREDIPLGVLKIFYKKEKKFMIRG